MVEMRPWPSAAWSSTETLPNRRYFLLVRVGAWSAPQMLRPAPCSSSLRVRWLALLTMLSSTDQKDQKASSQLAPTKSKETFLAKPRSGGQSVWWLDRHTTRLKCVEVTASVWLTVWAWLTYLMFRWVAVGDVLQRCTCKEHRQEKAENMPDAHLEHHRMERLK